MKTLDYKSVVKHLFSVYEIGKVIYESPNSIVYKVIQKHDNKRVIFKVLKPDHVNPEEQIRYKQEFEILNHLKLEGVIKVYELNSDGEAFVMIQEDFGGVSLQYWLKKWESLGTNSFLLPEFLNLAIKIANVMGQLHEGGIIHKNITPSNILFNSETKVIKLIDFGFATTLSREMPILKNPRILEGTLAYISPEQTGRMNRGIDFRADLYSIGVIFYEMLTGQLPFKGNDPLALIHAHMAITPKSVFLLNNKIPRIVSKIVMKLLAKNAEDRYKSSFGLKADLEKCKAVLLNKSDNMSFDFELGQDDYQGHLYIPEKLYGRSNEIDILLASFERVTAGDQEMIFTAGYAGVGKSALVAEVHKPITERRGNFISGKFDQYQQNTPYSAFTQAFSQFIELLLTEQEEILLLWKDRFLATLDGNGKVLTEVMPGLEKIIDSQQEVPKLGGQENRNRFNLTFRNFVKTICTPAQPLVLFIDDWQWADQASLELLKALFIGEKINHFLLIGAYRDNEVDQTHPFFMTLKDIDDFGIKIHNIELGNLKLEDVEQLMKETISSSTEDSLALVQLIYSKTKGNAFFTQQFLHNLYEEGLLRFDFNSHSWVWNLKHIEKQNITNNVVDLMMGRIKKLSPETARLIKLAACIGDEFDLQTLISIGKVDISVAMTNLLEGLTQGLIFPLDDYYKLHDTAALARFKFLHDRVHQAAYTGLPVPERQIIHLEIGRLLLSNTQENKREQNIFDIVQHYNQAIACITDKSERFFLMQLNMEAADMAYSSAAFRSAQVYLETALNLVSKDAWEKQYDLMLKLHSQLATVFSLTGDFIKLDEFSKITIKHAKTVVDTIQVKQARIQGVLARGTYAEAIDLGLKLIEDLGVSVKRNPSPEEAFGYLKEMADWFTEEKIEKLLLLPDAPEEVGFIMETAVLINGPIFNTNVNLSFVFVSRIMKLCFEKGLARLSPVNIATFALIIGAALHDIPKVRLLTNVTKKLFNEKYPVNELIPFLSVAIGGFILHRYEHLKNSLPVLAEGMQKGLITGGFQFAAYCAWWHAWNCLFLGFPLGKTKIISQQAVETCEKTQMQGMKDWSLQIQQVSFNLSGESKIPWILKGKAYDEYKLLPQLKQINDFAELLRVYFNKAWLHYLFGQWQDAVNLFRETEGYLPFGAGIYITPMFYFFDALANASLIIYKLSNEYDEILKRINHNINELEAWVRYAPVNYQHKKDLMEAEKARIEGRYWDAVTFFEKAIKGAKENEYLHEEALACERAADFYFAFEMDEVAQLYMTKAYEGYKKWEAWAKLEDLEKRYPQYTVKATPVFSLEEQTKYKQSLSHKIASEGSKVELQNLDLQSVMKASQFISGQIILEELLKKLMEVVFENAGAQNGSLILEEDGKWIIEVESIPDKKDIVFHAIEIEKSKTLCPSIIRYVIRSHESVVLDNAVQTGLFIDDPYIKQNQIKSVLCMPLINLGKLKGILYLENNLSTNMFTPDRIKVLELLAGQASIALENAHLYKQAQQEIVERKLAEEKIREMANLHQTILDTVNVGIVYLKKRKIQWANNTFYELYGIDLTQAIGMDISDLYVDANEYINVTNDIYSILYEGKLVSLEILSKRDDGSVFWVNTYGKAINTETPEEGSIWGIQDITHRKEAELALKKSEAILKATMGSMNDGVLVVTSEGKITHYNNCFVQIFSIPVDLLDSHDDERLINYAKNKLMHPDEFVQNIEKIYKTNNSTIDTIQFIDGRIIERLSFPLSEDSPIKGRVWLFRDITKQKETEEEIRKLNSELEARVLERTLQLEQANVDLEAFAYSVSHDLRTPLRHIDGFIRLMYSNISSPSETVINYYKKITNASKRMSLMIEELLNFSRLGRKELIVEPVDLNEIISDVIEEFKPDYEHRNIEWEIDKIPVIKGDKALLKIVFENLISNAVKYTSKNKLTIIEIGVSDRSENSLTIFVKDNGVGFDMLYAKNLFRVFQRLHSNQDFEGIGIGLANVKRIVNKHNGTITAQAKPGLGATFYVTLPV